MKEKSLSNNLKIHIDSVHEMKRPAKCNTCDASFVRKSVLNNHVSRVHEGKKLFKCKICDASFLQKNVLKNHVSRVHEEKNPL